MTPKPTSTALDTASAVYEREVLAFMHDHDYRCGRPAFLWHGQRPVAGQQVEMSCARHLDGRPINGNEPMVCDSCGRPLFGVDMRTSFLRSMVDQG